MKKPFAVGDRIRVYDLDRNLELAHVDCTITEILPNGQLYTNAEYPQPGKSPNGSFDASMVHPKQCRLLKKKPKPRPKPRSVWIMLFNPYAHTLTP